MRARGWPAIALALAVLLFIWAAAIAAFGGFSIRVLGVPFKSEGPFRALVSGAALGAIGLIASNFRFPSDGVDTGRFAARAAVTLAAVTFALGIAYGTFVAGGADAYGYVSEADHWAAGHVVVEAPLANEAAWPDAEWALTPLGYRPALQRGRMVPVYPPGLPLMMALANTIGGGPRGIYLVVPALAALSIWLTYLLGLKLAGPATGLLAAIALFSSPVFLLQLMAPMSDIPAMAFWLLATLLACGASPASVLASGAATAIAITIRPNLVALGVPLLFLVILQGASPKARIRRGLSWGLTAACGPLAIAIINAHLYGSPLLFGYDRLANLYSLRHTWTNLWRYSGWLLTTQTPFILLGPATIPLFSATEDRERRSLARWMLMFSACVALCYLWYLPFDHWSYLRFLIPAFPMLLVTASAALVRLTRHHRRANGILLATGLLLVCHGLWQGRVAFGVREGEARYRIAGEMAQRLPANAIVIANLHSGSVRYYGHRLTVRYEWLGTDEYEAAIRYLRERGYPIYVMLDDSELVAFHDRYAGVNDVSWMDGKPAGVAAGRVFLFELPNR